MKKNEVVLAFQNRKQFFRLLEYLKKDESIDKETTLVMIYEYLQQRVNLKIFNLLIK